MYVIYLKPLLNCKWMQLIWNPINFDPKSKIKKKRVTTANLQLKVILIPIKPGRLICLPDAFLYACVNFSSTSVRCSYSSPLLSRLNVMLSGINLLNAKMKMVTPNLTWREIMETIIIQQIKVLNHPRHPSKIIFM